MTNVTDPPNGSAVINAGTSVVYTPDPGYISLPGPPDSFSYTMIDGDGGTSSATVFVAVLDTDSSPTANDDPNAGTIPVNEGQTVNIDVLANDVGLGDEPLTVSTSGLAFPACSSNVPRSSAVGYRENRHRSFDPPSTPPPSDGPF